MADFLGYEPTRTSFPYPQIDATTAWLRNNLSRPIQDPVPARSSFPYPQIDATTQFLRENLSRPEPTAPSFGMGMELPYRGRTTPPYAPSPVPGRESFPYPQIDWFTGMLRNTLTPVDEGHHILPQPPAPAPAPEAPVLPGPDIGRGVERPYKPPYGGMTAEEYDMTVNPDTTSPVRKTAPLTPPNRYQMQPVAPPPPSSRYSQGIPKSDFIYTNPVAAQQAAASLQARLGYEQGQDQGYRQYLAAREAAQNQLAIQDQRAAELEKDRQLQREGFASSERSAALRGSYGDQFDQRNKAYQEDLKRRDIEAKRVAYNQAMNALTILNDPKIPEASKTKLKDPKYVRWNPTKGLWELGEGIVNPDATPGVTTISELQKNVTPPAAPAAPAPLTPPFRIGLGYEPYPQ